MLNLIGVSLLTALIVALLALRWHHTSTGPYPLATMIAVVALGIVVWSLMDDMALLGAAVLLFLMNALIGAVVTHIFVAAWTLRRSNQAARKDGDA